MKFPMGVALAFGVAGLAAAQTPAPAINANPMKPTNGAPMLPNPATGRAPANRPPMVVAPGPDLDLSIEAAKAAVAACAGKHIGVAVLDQAGLPKLYYIPNGSSGSHAYMAFRKANTALLVKGPSENIVEKLKTDPELRAKVAASDDYISFAGGLPIVVNGQIIGAIAVSGAGPSEIDKGCAAAGLKIIEEKQN